MSYEETNIQHHVEGVVFMSQGYKWTPRKSDSHLV